MVWWAWLVLGIVLMAIEISNPGDFYFLFFGISATLVGFFALLGLGEPAWVQWLFFSLLSVVGVFVLRKPLVERARGAPGVVDVDVVLGQTAVAAGTIAPGGKGKVRLRGSEWEARNLGEEALPNGAVCIVESVDGLLLGVRAGSATQPAAAGPAA